MTGNTAKNRVRGKCHIALATKTIDAARIVIHFFFFYKHALLLAEAEGV